MEFNKINLSNSNEEQILPVYIIKRDGVKEIFDIEKIRIALTKCYTNSKIEQKISIDDTMKVITRIISNTQKFINNIPTIEEIQDIVEFALLINKEFDAAKSYILYREEHNKIRKERPIPNDVKEAFIKSDKYFPTPIQKFQFYDKYSRFDYTKARRETWIETVDRTVNYLKELSENKLTNEDYDKIRQYILEMKVMPSMRLLAMAGPAARRNNISIYNCSFVPIDSIDAFVETLIISMNGCGVGYSVERHHIEKLPRIIRQTGIVKDTYVVEDTAEGWADALRIGLETWFEGKDIIFDYSKLRPFGAPLKTKGGRSSGPEPLKHLMKFTREKILSKQGGFLSSLDAHDIQCIIGEASISGGVRRTALIALFDYDDMDMLYCKSGDALINNPHRWNANNSAVWPNRRLSQEEILNFMNTMFKSGRGEPGIFNRRAVFLNAPKRRLESGIDPYIGTNPCVSGDTKILTKKGNIRIDSLVGQQIEIWNGYEWSEVIPSITGKDQPMFQIRLSNGMEIKCTDYHEWVLNDDTRVKTRDLKIGNKIKKYNLPIINFDKKLDYAYELGLWIGDGNADSPYMRFYKEKINLIQYISKECTPEYYDNIQDFVKVNMKNVKDAIPNEFNKTFVPHEYDIDSKLKWLAGLIDSDGTSVSGKNFINIQISSINKEFLLDIQQMLITLGISSTVSLMKIGQTKLLPDGKGNNKYYQTKDSFRLTISSRSTHILLSLGLKTNRVNLHHAKFVSWNSRYSERFIFIKSIKRIENEPIVYCFTEPKNHTGVFNGIMTGQCGEINLYQNFCNLSSVVSRAEDTFEDLKEKVRIATIIGTIQSSATYFPGLRKIWTENAQRERLLGVDLNGQMDSKIVQDKDVQLKLKEIAIETNKEYAKKLGINESVSVTTVKPSGNSSQLLNSSSGIHSRWSKYYIRNIRVSSSSPLYKVLKDELVPMDPENGQDKLNATSWVIHFPVKSPDGAIVHENRGAIEQLEYWKQVKLNYTEHNPSVTITYKPDEVIDIVKWVYENQDIIVGITFLPQSDALYDQMPYEEITKEEFDELSKNFPNIDFSKIYRYELNDLTTASQEMACLGAACDMSL